MDTVTHAMMGAIVASPILASHPFEASAFVFGSVLPDLDVLSRLFGKRAFLNSHQTYSHALPVIAFAGVVCFVVMSLLDLPVHCLLVAFALSLGMLFHTLLDYTNTYGITLLAPFSVRRVCREWVFFLDAFVIASCLAALSWLTLQLYRDRPLGYVVQLTWAGTMLGYWLLRAYLRRRAMGFCPPGILALLPSAAVPWQYLGCARTGDVVTNFRIDAITGRTSSKEHTRILDAPLRDLLARVPEFQAMRRLSPAYHVVRCESQGATRRIACRDLRTRNFNTTFGDLELRVDASGRVLERKFHV